MKKGDRRSIIVFISLQCLREGTKWFKTLASVARRGLISGFCVDEAHATVEHSDSFRPESAAGVQSINVLTAISQKHHPGKELPYLVMPATFTIPEQRQYNAMCNRFPDMVDWGEMDKRNVGVFCKIAGDPVNELLKDWKKNVTKTPDAQSLLYSNSAQVCEDSLLNRLEKKLSEMDSNLTTTDDGKEKEFIPLTCDCGIMLKSYLMAAFCDDGNDDDNRAKTLPSILTMPCTSAAQCGISSQRCNKCYRYGPCPNWHDFVQEMDRVDRSHLAEPGEHCYYLYPNVTTFLTLWLRSQRQTKKKVRDRHEKQLFDWLKAIILPEKCYHEYIEEYFENPATYKSRGPCGDQCSFCDGSFRKFSGAVSKPQLMCALQANIFDRGSVPADKFVSYLTDKKNQNKLRKTIWGEGIGVVSGQIHGLVLMLFASKLVTLELSNDAKQGTKNIKMKNVLVKLTKVQVTKGNDVYDNLAINYDEYWKGFHFK